MIHTHTLSHRNTHTRVQAPQSSKGKSEHYLDTAETLPYIYIEMPKIQTAACQGSLCPRWFQPVTSLLFYWFPNLIWSSSIQITPVNSHVWRRIGFPSCLQASKYSTSTTIPAISYMLSPFLFVTRSETQKFCDQLRMHQVLIITTAAEIYFFTPTLASIEIKWN